MQDKALDRAEQDLLAVIRQLHADQGPVARNVLSVVARGRGLDVALPLRRLRALGLVEEYERRPFFLKRLFGARTVTVVGLTEAGLVADPATVSERAPLAPVEVQAEISAEVIVAPEVPVEAPELPASVPTVEPVPSQAKKIPVPAPQHVASISAFTEVLGGAPLADEPFPVAVDPHLNNGLREVLEGVGMEMTMAGEALIADRITKGASAGEALSQLVLFAFAHAVRHDVLSQGAIHSLGLTNYAVEVMRELEKLGNGGEIGDAQFEDDMRRLLALVEDTPERGQRAEDILVDPVGGAAPPALLPEDLRQAEEKDED